MIQQHASRVDTSLPLPPRITLQHNRATTLHFPARIKVRCPSLPSSEPPLATNACLYKGTVSLFGERSRVGSRYDGGARCAPTTDPSFQRSSTRPPILGGRARAEAVAPRLCYSGSAYQEWSTSVGELEPRRSHRRRSQSEEYIDRDREGR
jgi:hypothetical protein